jgi:hypothetical protein
MKNKYLSLFLALLLSLCTLSCNNDVNDNEDRDWSEEQIVEISSEIVPVSVLDPPYIVDGMLVRIKGESQWIPRPTTEIIEFEFEPGYSYTLKVNITHLANPPQDGSNVRITLISLISKIKAEE